MRIRERLQRFERTLQRWTRKAYQFTKLRAAIIIAISFVGLALFIVVWAPGMFVTGLDNDADTTARLKAENDVRTTLVQVLAGGVLALGGYFTYRQLHTTREGQITERYTRAIDQLGHTELNVRLGGIYALERIARDSNHDHLTVAEVLTAFIRGRAPWPPGPGQHIPAARVDQIPPLGRRAPDVQASLTVLGRGRFGTLGPSRPRLDLTSTDLRCADLTHANLEGADLSGSHLEGAELFRARLDAALLWGAHLNGAHLFETHLEEASLINIHLEDTFLSGTHLEGAHLSSARLRGARLGGAYLTGADLSGADLREVNETSLYQADLRSVTANIDTTWPKGFDWRGAGVVLQSS